MQNLPWPVWALVLTGAVALIASAAVMLQRSGLAAGCSRRTAGRLGAGMAAAWAGWLLVAALIARSGALGQGSNGRIPWIGLAVAAPFLAALAAARLPGPARALSAPGTAARLVVPQVFRVVGAVFLVVWLLGDVPARFALPAGLGDVAVGIAAPFVARRLAAGDRRAGLWFNLLGLLDLVVAVTIGFLSAQGPYQVLGGSPDTTPLTLLPLALVPTVAVPLAAALHVLSLRRLPAVTSAASRPSAEAADRADHAPR